MPPLAVKLRNTLNINYSLFAACNMDIDCKIYMDITVINTELNAEDN